MGSVVLMAESAANSNSVSEPKDQASPPGFVLALAQSSRRVSKPYKSCPTQTDPFHLQQEQHMERQGHCPAEWRCFDLAIYCNFCHQGSCDGLAVIKAV